MARTSKVVRVTIFSLATENETDLTVAANLAAEGSEDAARELISHYAPSMRALSRIFLDDDTEVDRAVQQALIIVITNLEAGEGTQTLRERFLRAACRESLARLSCVQVERNRGLLHRALFTESEVGSTLKEP